MDYQTIKPMTKGSQKRKTPYRNSFAEHNYNYVNKPQTIKSSSTNTQNHLFSQSKNLHQPLSNSKNFNDYLQTSQDRSENYTFFQQNKHNTQRNDTRHQTPIIQLIGKIITRIIYDFIKTSNLVLII